MQSSKSLWFDLRKVNLDRYDKSVEKGYLLIRFFNQFLLADLDDFLVKMVDWERYVMTTGSGVHWKFIIRESDGSYFIRSLVNKREVLIIKVDIEYFKKQISE